MSEDWIKINIYFLRHAQSEFNKAGLIQGQHDSDLSEHGVRQAQDAAERLKSTKFDLIYSSDLSRAFNTAQLVLDKNELKTPSDSIITDKRIRERFFGEFQGKEKKFYEDASRNRQNPEINDLFKDIESNSDLHKRWEAFFESLCEQVSQKKLPHANVLIVSHGSFMREAFKHAQNHMRCEFSSVDVNQNKNTANTGLTIFSLDLRNGRWRNFKCVLFNDSSHLLAVNDSKCDL